MKILFVLSLFFFLSGCQSAIEKSARNAGYSLYELVGVEKRDLLRKRITGATEEQKEAGESFTDALDKLQKTYGSEPSKLESKYRELNSAYENSVAQAEEVRSSREKMHTVASDLFAEWKKEIAEMQSADLKTRSRTSLADTKERFDKMHSALKNSEGQMAPVLAKLKDNVLFLKHNLNAKAVGSLKNENARIEGDIKKLLAGMNDSIREAEAFIKTIE